MKQPIIHTYNEEQEISAFEVFLDKMTANTFLLFLIIAIPVIIHMFYSLFTN